MEHVRIDEGIDRPQYPQAPMARALEGQSWTIPTKLDPDQILLDYLIAGKTSGIALQYGLRRGALTRWLQSVRPREWKEIQIIRALCTKEDGEEAIYDAATALQLARARELVRSAQWNLERLDPANYAPKQEVTVKDERDLGDRLRRARERVIEGEVVKSVALPQTAQLIESVGGAGQQAEPIETIISIGQSETGADSGS